MSEHLKILTIIGTRPEAIKLAPVVQQFCHHPAVTHKTVLTGQHRELLQSALNTFSITGDLDLALMEPNQSLATLNAKALAALNKTLLEEQPDWVVVQGDTTTAFVAALAAFYLRIKVAHVEAGLRTDDLVNPFPEEANRRLIDQLATLYFAPTSDSRSNLLREGIPEDLIDVTGNTGIDALLQVAARAPRLRTEIADGKRLVLMTAHRRENFGAPVADICRAVKTLIARNPDIAILYAVHPNPNIFEPVSKELSGVERVVLTKAMDYEQFVAAMCRCEIILTDSGGIQEEAPSLDKPVLVMREATERMEAIEAGAAKLVGTSSDRIITETEHLLRDSDAYSKMASAKNPFGDGTAAIKIARRIVAFSGGPRQFFQHRAAKVHSV